MNEYTTVIYLWPTAIGLHPFKIPEYYRTTTKERKNLKKAACLKMYIHTYMHVTVGLFMHPTVVK